MHNPSTQSLIRLARTLVRRTNTFSRSLTTPVPWFVDQQYEQPQRPFVPRQQPPHLKSTPPTAATVPEDAPKPVKLVHAALSHSPHLDLSTLVASRAAEIPAGPALPLRAPQGRRQRGSTYGGESAYDVPGTIWNWTVMAQVKEGTEDRGAIESVVRVIRKTLASVEPPLGLPPKSKRRMGNGWAMVDGGDFAVHVLSKEAREKYFGEDRWRVW